MQYLIATCRPASSDPPGPVHSCSIGDASKAMAACQEKRLDSQPEHPLRISYARDRFAGDPHYQQVRLGEV